MNKKIVLICIFLLASSLLLLGCGDDEAEINLLLDDFSQGMLEWNVELLRDVLSSDEVEELEADEDLVALFEEFEIVDREIRIDDKQAEVSAVIKMTVSGVTDEINDTINLIKEDDDWKIENSVTSYSQEVSREIENARFSDDEIEINSVLDDFCKAMAESDLELLRSILVNEEAETITEEDREIADLVEKVEIVDREIEIYSEYEFAEVSAVVKTTMFGTQDITNDIIELVIEDGSWKIKSI